MPASAAALPPGDTSKSADNMFAANVDNTMSVAAIAVALPSGDIADNATAFSSPDMAANLQCAMLLEIQTKLFMKLFGSMIKKYDHQKSKYNPRTVCACNWLCSTQYYQMIGSQAR